MQGGAQNFRNVENAELNKRPISDFNQFSRIIFVNELDKFDIVVVPPIVFSPILSVKLSNLITELNSVPRPKIKTQLAVSFFLFLVIFIAAMLLIAFLSVYFILLMVLAFALVKAVSSPDTYFKKYKERIMSIISAHSAQNALIARMTVRNFSLNSIGICFLSTIEPLGPPQVYTSPMVYGVAQQMAGNGYPQPMPANYYQPPPPTIQDPNLCQPDVPLTSPISVQGDMQNPKMYQLPSQDIPIYTFETAGRFANPEPDHLQPAKIQSSDYPILKTQEVGKDSQIDLTFNENDKTTDPFFAPNDGQNRSF